jgi:hypothetical protein
MWTRFVLLTLVAPMLFAAEPLVTERLAESDPFSFTAVARLKDRIRGVLIHQGAEAPMPPGDAIVTKFGRRELRDKNSRRLFVFIYFKDRSIALFRFDELDAKTIAEAYRSVSEKEMPDPEGKGTLIVSTLPKFEPLFAELSHFSMHVDSVTGLALTNGILKAHALPSGR